MTDDRDGEMRAYLDGELDAKAREVLAQSLASEPKLASRMDEIRRLGTEADALLAGPVRRAGGRQPPRLENNHAQAGRDDGRAPVGTHAARAATRRVWIWATAAVAVAAVLLLLVSSIAGRPASSGEVSASARQTVQLGARATAVAEAGAELQWEVKADGDTRVRQPSGAVFYRVDAGGAFVVQTPAGTVEVTGTCFTVEMMSMKEWIRKKGGSAAGGAVVGAALMLTVHEGSVVLANGDGSMTVDAGQVAVAEGGRSPRAHAADTQVEPDNSGLLAEFRDRDAEQRKEIANLTRELADKSGAPSQSDDTVDPIRKCANSVGDPNCSTVSPAPGVLDEMARCGSIKVDRPEFLQQRLPTGYAPPDKLTALVDLSDEEVAAITTANEAFADGFSADLQQIVADLNDGKAPPVPPGAPAWAIIPSFIAAMNASGPQDNAAAMRRTIAEERAGWSTAPPWDGITDPYERYERMRADVGERYEAALGEAIGAERAHELRIAGDGWGTTALYGGACPDDKPPADDD